MTSEPHHPHGDLNMPIDIPGEYVRLVLEENSNQTLRTSILQRLLSAATKLHQATEQHKEKTIIICPDHNSSRSLMETVFLFGGVLILTQQMEATFLATTFKDYADEKLMPTTENRNVTVLNCWQALQHVRDIGWMSWKDGTDQDDQPFLVDEFLHYADAINGGVHIVAPGQLLLFHDPVDLPEPQQWAVISYGDGSCSRHFSPAFYADLFLDLGVAAVACLTESATSGAAFASRSIEACDLRPGGGGSILRALDGLLSLSRGAAESGGVALHGGGGWPSDTGIVVAAWLVSRAGFQERAAYAWLEMLCPWLPLPGGDLRR